MIFACRFFALSLLGLVLLNGVAYAQGAVNNGTQSTAAPAAPTVSVPTAASVDPAALTTAKELIQLTKSDSMVQQMLPTIVNSIMPLVERDNPEKHDLIKQMMEQYFIPSFMVHIDDMRSQLAIIYASNFTADELQQLIAFYKTPVGQKYLSVAPAIVAQSMAVGRQWGLSAGREAAQKLVDEMRKNNMHVPKEIGL